MKNLLLFLLLILSVFPQQFSRLNGLEDSQGNTILLYSLGLDASGRFCPVFKYNLATEIETIIMDGYSYVIDPFNSSSKSISDYEFFPNDLTNFINVGLTVNMDPLGYAARNDTITYTDWGIFFVDISKQHPNQVYISDFHNVIRSFDSGYTYLPDSTIEFEFLSVADFNDRVFFGTDNNRLVKSEDQGFTFSIVDTSNIQTSQPGLAFYYDVNQYHIYRLNKSYNKFTLNVSNNKGNANSWTKTYESDTQIFISIDSTQSGVVFLADGRSICKSVNNGYTFAHYKSLPSKLVGIYKKPNSDILYAASKRMIFKVTPDSMSIIKSLLTPDDEYGWFPLAIGNRWAYDSYWSEENMGYPPTSTFAGTTYMKVIKDTVIQNKSYFVVENNLLTRMIFEPRMFLRVDSTTGFVYRYWEDLNGEFLFHNLNAEVGDTIPDPLFPEEPYYVLLSEEPISFLDNETFIRNYWENLPCGCGHSLIKGFGLSQAHFNEFGGSDDYLKGCVINGVLYGDTTLTDINEKTNSIPTQYKLEQNYPNPFNPSTTISWQSPVSSWQSLKVYDVLGNEVATLVNEDRNAGSYDLKFNANNLLDGRPSLPSGIYFYRIRIGSFTETKKMILLK